MGVYVRRFDYFVRVIEDFARRLIIQLLFAPARQLVRVLGFTVLANQLHAR
jgi:hypothetical protein